MIPATAVRQALMSVLLLFLAMPTLASTPAIDADVDRLIAVFDGADEDPMEEAVVQLSWAGIPEPRLYDHLLARIRSGQMERWRRDVYIEALGWSGNPDVYEQMRAMIRDSGTSRPVRKALEDALKEESSALRVVSEINVDTANARSVEDLWAIRHRNGLRVSDSARMHLAARDMYTFSYEKPSLDIAAEVLATGALVTTGDDDAEDALAWLCRALGAAGRIEYKAVLIDVANHAVSEKVSEYAVAAVRRFDRRFEARRSE
jgi:hypothetical protein